MTDDLCGRVGESGTAPAVSGCIASFGLEAGGRPVPSPNGLAMNPAETIVHVDVMQADAVRRVPLLPSGGFIQLRAVLEGRIVWRPTSKAIPGLAGTKTAYGGANNRTLFITRVQSGCILAADLDVPGQAMFGQMQGRSWRQAAAAS